ncbi:MAG: carbamoyltransferase HypF [Ignavibacteria bacterium]|nr:carbamoyltransferase HypF [Ignavibacteria bacterium]
MKNVLINIQGTVQGVGFRPFVYRLAQELNIKGWIINSSAGVQIEAEGDENDMEKFLTRLKNGKPVNSTINDFKYVNSDIKNFTKFEIKESNNSTIKTALILPDLATCPDCLNEIFNPKERRYLYPFTNCTNCGPRFSIIESIPYDRANTTMKEFEMCNDCRNEYKNPLDRRFHAEPIACPKCGPQIKLYNERKELIAGNEIIKKAAEVILNGKIIALKGLGGYQLIVDARNNEAVKRLRERKHREEKPFAMMFPSLELIKKCCEVSGEEERLLLSVQSPIVLLKKKENNLISEDISKENNYYGVMLPYTPLHHLLMKKLNTPIVATSGNISDEPICITNEESFEKLNSIADFFLTHDRKIVRQVDDSVVRVIKNKPFMIRRARGYAPYPLILDEEIPSVIAVGGQLKNTVAISNGKNVFISQHIGDLDSKEAYSAFKKIISDFKNLYDINPEYIISDLHPDYVSTKFAQDKGLKLIQVQHHYSHILSCIAENNIEGEVLGISWDGTGYGTDGNIWGGEFLKVNKGKFERFAHFDYFPLAGGEKAIKEVWRIGASLLYTATKDKKLVKSHYKDYDTEVILNLVDKKINSPLCSSVGRLFDGIASLINLKQDTSFEGQAAMDLENTLDEILTNDSYKFEIIKTDENNYIVDWRKVVVDIFNEFKKNISRKKISAKFHNALTDVIIDVSKISGIKHIALSGGCFQNKYLIERTIDKLRDEGFKVFWQSEIPTNDAGISLGQMKYFSYLNKIKN